MGHVIWCTVMILEEFWELKYHRRSIIDNNRLATQEKDTRWACVCSVNIWCWDLRRAISALNTLFWRFSSLFKGKKLAELFFAAHTNIWGIVRLLTLKTDHVRIQGSGRAWDTMWLCVAGSTKGWWIGTDWHSTPNKSIQGTTISHKRQASSSNTGITKVQFTSYDRLYLVENASNRSWWTVQGHYYSIHKTIVSSPHPPHYITQSVAIFRKLNHRNTRLRNGITN